MEGDPDDVQHAERTRGYAVAEVDAGPCLSSPAPGKYGREGCSIPCRRGTTSAWFCNAWALLGQDELAVREVLNQTPWEDRDPDRER
jgi:hypothetical protein